MTSSALERIRVSQMRSASSPELGCGHEQIIKVNTELLRILRIERMLDVDEGGEAAAFLRLRDYG